MHRVKVNDRYYDVPDGARSDQLQAIEPSNGRHRLLRRDPAGGYTLVQPGSQLEVQDGDEFVDAPPRVKGADARLSRVSTEAFLLAAHYGGGVRFDEKGGGWIELPSFPLPPRWNKESARLLILLPPSYPVVPPIGFYLNEPVKLKTGDRDPYFVKYGAHGAADLRDVHWYWYCATIKPGAWRPRNDPRQPDNLISFAAMAYEALSQQE